VTTRRLGLADVGGGARHGGAVPLSAPWLVSAVRRDRCGAVAQARQAPLAPLSVELGLRRLSHCARASDRGEHPELVPSLGRHARLLGLVNAHRNRHKDRKHQDLEIWGAS
jgi:hypothetical protein